jgi:chorismate dehydratase
VSYLNTLPLIAGLEKLPQIRLLPMVPSAIAATVVRGEAEIGLCSLVDCLTHGLTRLPVGMIACDGPTMTVRVFSKVPLSQIHTLHADGDSHTSVVLAQLLLRRICGVKQLEVKRWSEHEQHAAPEALLMIGDKVVLRAPAKTEYPHVLDLGEAWKELAGLPFVYAMWATTRERSESDRTKLVMELLDRQRRHNAGRMGWIVQTHAPRLGWPVDSAETYLQELLRFGPDARSEAGAELFLSMAVQEGLLKKS